MARRIRVGIIGCGKIAQVRHLPEYHADPQALITGFYDFNRERTERLSQKYGGRVYDSVEEMLNDPAIDAVSVCTSNNTHADITVKALEAGKHVLCEKPMAVTMEDCRRMEEASRRTGMKLMIDQNQRLAKGHIKAKELIAEGAIGRIITFRTTFGHGGPETWSINPGPNVWFFDKKQGGLGAMADLGIHKTDLIQYLLDTRVSAVTAYMGTLDKRFSDGSKIGVEDNAVCIYEMENGAVGTMTASWTYYGREDNSTILYGTKGVIKIYDDEKSSIRVQMKNGEQIIYQLDQMQTNDDGGQSKTGVMESFIDCILNDKDPVISAESVMSAMGAVFKAVQSAQEGKRLEVAEAALDR